MQVATHSAVARAVGTRLRLKLSRSSYMQFDSGKSGGDSFEIETDGREELYVAVEWQERWGLV